MSYTPPVVFTTATPVLADDLNANNDAFRKYINKNVIQADLAADTFDTPDIIKGEYYNVVQDHQFTTGDIYTQNTVADSAGERSYFTSTYKATKDMQWSFNNQYQTVTEMGKTIYFEGNNALDINTNQAAKVIITGHLGVRNYWMYTYNTDYNTNGIIETRFYLLYKIEGVSDQWAVATQTVGGVQAFEEYQNMTPPADGFDGPNDRRVIPFLFEYDIPNLWATYVTPSPKPQSLAWRFAIGVETTIELGWVNNRFMRCEVFYC